MTQKTLVVKIPPARRAAIRARLSGGDFEFRRVPHAAWSVKGEGFVATLYESGKLVVQGATPEAFLVRYTDEDAPPERRDAAPERTGAAALDVVTVGSDETGKGDYFGPLVVAAARVTPEQVADLDRAGVMDSKKLTDGRALLLGAALRLLLPYHVVRVDPEEYNRRYPQYGGLNPFLGDLHAEAIRAVAQPDVRVLVDQFANARVMRAALKGTRVQLEQATRAERNPAVAAASIIARQEFLLALHELSEECGVALHKGAGAPVDRAGVEYVRAHGFDALGRVAKLHFKNTGKIEVRVR